MAYDAESREFKIYSEDIGLLGDKEITVKAYLEDYDSRESAIERTTIKIVNPCESPFSLQATP